MNTEQFDGHTPGPWDYEIPETGDNIVVDSEGAFVAQVSCREDSNTRLIAAAPDLLAALRELLDAIHWDAFSDDDATLEIDRAVAERIRRGD